jgi:hypothetical protein
MSWVKLEHRVGIQAPAETIWAIVSDIGTWPEWCALYPKAAGVIRMGAELALDVAVPGQPVRSIKPVVEDWVPNEQLIWRLSMLGGLVKTTRYFEIEELTPSACIFANGEMFEGFLGPRVAKRISRPLKTAFRDMGDAVKRLAEEAAPKDDAAG